MIFPASMAGTIAARVAVTRGIGLLVVWIVIAGVSLSDLAAGIVAVMIATWVSLVLYPPGAEQIRFVPSMRLGFRLLIDSVVAGSDVARRALDPRLPLNPGLIRYSTLLARGPTQATFKTIICLVPGTLSIGSAPDGTLLVHCLDVAQPVVPGLARNEALLLGALGRRRLDA